MADNGLNSGSNLPKKRSDTTPSKKVNMDLARKQNLPEKPPQSGSTSNPNSTLQTWSVPAGTGGGGSGIHMTPPPTPPHPDSSRRRRPAPKPKKRSSGLASVLDSMGKFMGHRGLLLGSLALLALSNMSRFGMTAYKTATGMELLTPGKGKVTDPAVEGGMKIYVHNQATGDVDTNYYQVMKPAAFYGVITPKLVKKDEAVDRLMSRDEIDDALVLKFQYLGIEISRAVKYEADFTGKTAHDLALTDRILDMAIGHDQGMIGVPSFPRAIWTGPDDPHKDKKLADGTTRIDTTVASPFRALYEFVDAGRDIVVIPVSKSKFYDLQKENGWVSSSTESGAKNNAPGRKGP